MSTVERARTLRSLVRLLVDASEVVIKEWETEALPPRKQYLPSVPSPELFEASRVILGACGMVVDLMQDPVVRLTEVVSSFFTAKALHIAVKARVADILVNADPLKGISITNIGHQTGIQEQKLLQVLRCLCTLHIFSEVKSNHFVNTPTSRCMVDNEPIRAWLLLSTEGSAAAEQLPTVLFDPVKTYSTSSREAAFQEAYGTQLTLWEYIEEQVEQPDGTLQARPELSRWITGMTVAGQIESGALYYDYPWEALSSQPIVDVGGGIGGMSLELARRFPNLRFVVQDREVVIRKAEQVWLQELPVALQTERVQLMAHDFFTKQPVKSAAAFLMRHILHDWPDEACVVILRQIRDAMQADTPLLVVDKAVHSTAGSALLRAAPSPLPPNYGYAEHYSSFQAICMLTMFNGVERTPEELAALAAQAGLRVVKVWECRGMMCITELRRDDYVD